MAPNLGPQTVQLLHVPAEGAVRDGDGRVDQSKYQLGKLGHFTSTYQHIPIYKTSKNPLFCNGHYQRPILSPTDGSTIFCKNLHEVDKVRSLTDADGKNTSAPVSG